MIPPETYAETPAARLRRTEAELGSALSRLAVLEKRCAELELIEPTPPLPVTDDEIRAFYADLGLNLSCGPAVLFAALRRYFNQSEGDPS